MAKTVEAAFQRLAREAAACRLCARLCDRTAILSRRNGSLTPQVMFIAEAPGRLGADRTGIPLVGDLSGRNFSIFLNAISLSRDEIFITNAVLCNPREGERNARPTATELANCRELLRRQIELLQPAVVATLGLVALKTLAQIAPHAISLRDVGGIFDWFGRKLVPLYHPSPHVVNTRRRVEQQIADYQAILRALEQLSEPLSQQLAITADGKPRDGN